MRTATAKSAVIDYSNAADGYVMVQFTAATTGSIKVQVADAANTYTYPIKAQKWAVLPLTSGNGTYKVTVFLGISGDKYATVLSESISVTLSGSTAPFIRPSLYVNYSEAPNTVSKAASLCSGKSKDLDKIKAVYDFVVTTLTYDYALAASVQSGYIPDLDAVLAKKKGICYDYAALMCGMLRSQGIPCKMVHGYANGGYHAWISVYTKESGWIDAYIQFDGKSWKRMDPTFASTGGVNDATMKIINNDAAYTAKYVY